MKIKQKKKIKQDLINGSDYHNTREKLKYFDLLNKEIFAKDKVWLYPKFLTSDIPKKYKTINEACQENVEQAMFESRNWHKHDTQNEASNRDILKPFFPNHKSFKWLAVVSDITSPDPESHNSFILLDHILLLSDEKKMSWCYFTQWSHDIAIDYHLWLPVNNIKYFGNKDYQDIAIGDAIVGESYAKRYRTKGRIQYGFGLTNILHCGVMKMDETVAGIRGATSINPRIISDYDRGDFLVAKLVYSAVYNASLNRYRKKTIENLKHINLTIGIKIINFEKENYHSRFTDGDLLAEKFKEKSEQLSQNIDENQTNGLLNRVYPESKLPAFRIKMDHKFQFNNKNK